VVLLSGEAGIGKSRLVHVLKDHASSEPHTRLKCRSSPHDQHSALYPIIDLLHRLLQWQHNASPEEQLDILVRALSQYRLPMQEAIPLLAPLLSLSLPEDRYLPLTFSPQRQRQKTLEVILAMLLALSASHPVLLILEDLHWTDPSPPGTACSAHRPNTDRFLLRTLNVPSNVSATLEQPFVCDPGDTQPLIAALGGTDGGTRRGWQAFAGGGAAADRREDRWCAAVCGRK
jgi:AAA ATPase domain